jgi:hypothetical protein
MIALKAPRLRVLQDFGLLAAVAGVENFISAASSVSPFGFAWMSTRSPTARSASFAGLS